MKPLYAIGIDLGTSTSEICMYKDGKVIPISDPGTKIPIVPSLVAVNSRGDLLVGEDARNIVDRPGYGIREIKRQMGSGDQVSLRGQDFRPEEISAQILKKLKRNAEERLGVPVRDVVLSVPAFFPDTGKQATVNAGEIAGLNILRIISEPTAAALAFGIENIGVDEQLVIFDFGGGTLDISVLEMAEGILTVKSTFGDKELGGKDFDEALIQLIRQKFLSENDEVSTTQTTEGSLKGVAEQVKIALSRSDSHMASIASYASKNGTPVDLDVVISRVEFEQSVAQLLDRARDCVRQALKAGKVRPSAIDRILLVGGTTYIPCVRALVTEMFGKEPRADVDPDLAVCMGAAIQSALAQGLIGEDKGIIIADVCPFGLGVDVLETIGGRSMLIYDPLILPNTTIPYSTNKSYTLLYANQEAVNISLYQDSTGAARLLTDAIDTEFHAAITDIPPSKTGVPHSLEVQFSYNVNGLVELRASIPNTGQTVQIDYSPSVKRMSTDQKSEARQRAETLDVAWKQHRKTRHYLGVIEKAERLIEQVPSGEMPSLVNALTELKTALANDDESRISSSGDRLIDLIFDIDTSL